MKVTNIFKAVYEFDNWLKNDIYTVVQQIYNKSYSYMTDKYINNDSHLCRFFISLDDQNQSLFINHFIVKYPQYTIDELKIGLNIMTWIYWSVGTYNLYKLLQLDFNDNDKSMNTNYFNYAYFMYSLENTQQDILYNEYISTH